MKYGERPGTDRLPGMEENPFYTMEKKGAAEMR
jgi:hypothetical protein